MSFPWTRFQRILATAVLGVAFIGMASIFVPFNSQAQDGGTFGPRDSAHQASPSFSTDPHEGLGSLGTLEQHCYHVHIYATDVGPRYSVYDSVTGEELAVLLNAERVAELFPDVPLPTMEFGAPMQLMHTDPMGRNWPR